MRRSVKAKAAIYSAATAVMALGAARMAHAQTVVSQYSGDNFVNGSNWVNDYSGPVGTNQNTSNNVQVLNAFGTHAGVNVSAGGFTVPKVNTTPPGGLTTYTVAAVFEATANVVTGNNVYQAQSIYGYDVGGAGTPDMGIGFGASGGQSFVAGAGTNGSGDLTINTGAMSLNTVHTIVMQEEDPGAAAGQGTLTVWVDGALIEQLSGYTFAPLTPASAGGPFGLGGGFGGGFATTTTKGLLGLVQVYDDTTGVNNGQTLSNTLAANYGGTSELFTFNAASGSLSTGSNFLNGAAPDITGAAEALIANGGTATISSNFNTASIVLGNGPSTSGYVLQTTGAYNANSGVTIGAFGGTGIYNMTGGSLTTTTANEGFHLVGNTAAGAAATQLIVGGTAVVNTKAEFDVGYTTGSIAGAATLNISGGTVNETGSSFYVANGPSTLGNLYISGGALNVSGGSLNIAKGTSTTGNLYVSGGNLNVSGGAFTVASGVGSVGNLYLSGGSIQNSNGQLTIANGVGTVGTFNITGGSYTSTKVTAIGEGNGSNGTLVLNGGTMNLSADLWIGDANGANNHTGGNGLFIMNGGLINSTSWFVVGRGGSSTGLFVMNGGTIIHTNDGGNNNSFEVSSYGGNNGTANTGTFNLNGGTLSTGYIRDESPNGGVQQIYLNGGTLISNNGDASFLGATNTSHVSSGDTINAYIRNGGVVLGTNGSTGIMGISDVLQHSNFAGDLAADGGVTSTGTGSITLSANNTFTGPVNANGSGYLILTGTNAYNGATTVNDGILQISFDAALGNSTTINLKGGQLINNGTSFTIGSTRTFVLTGTGFMDPGWNGYTVSGPVTGTGNLSVPFDSGTLTLTASNSYQGSTTIGSNGSDGTHYYGPANGVNGIFGITLGNANALPAGTALTFGIDQGTGYSANSANLNMNGYNASVGLVNGGASAIIQNITPSTASVLTLGLNTGNSALLTSTSTGTYLGQIRDLAYNSTWGTVSVNKVGPGIQVLGGTMNYSGATTVNGGRLYINGTSVNSAFSVASGASLGGTGVIYGPVTLASGGTLEGGYLGAGNLNLPAGAVVPGGGTFAIGNVNNYTNPAAAGIQTTALNFSGGTVGVTVAAALGGLSVGSVYDLVSYTSEPGAATALAISGSLPSRATGILTDTSTGTSSTATGFASPGTIELTITGVDFLKWTGAFNSNWDTTTGNTASASLSNWKLNSGATPGAIYIDNPGDTVVFDDTASNFSVNMGALILHPNSVTFNNSTHAYTVSGTGGISGLTGVTLLGSNTVTMNTSNSYLGATLIAGGGTLALTSGGSIGTSSVTVQNGAFTVGSGASIASTSVAVQNGTFTVGSGASIAPTTVTLGNALTNGTMQLGDAGGASNVSLTSLTTSGTGAANAVVGGNAAVSTLTLTVTGTDTYSGFLGSGAAGTTPANALALVKTGAGTLALTGANTYTGGTTITGGTVSINNGSALGTGNVTITGNSTILAASNASLPSTVNFVLNTTSDTFNTNGNILTINGSITNTAADVQPIKPTGTGTLVLAGVLNVIGGPNDTNNNAIQMNTTGTTTSITGTGSISGISMGWLGSSNTLLLNPGAGSGTLTLTNSGNSTVTTNSDDALDVGQTNANAAGAIIQSGGTVTTNSTIELGKWDGAYGSYTMNGGTLNVADIFSGGAGNGNGNSYFLQNAGTVNVANFTSLGQGGSGTNVLYITGGTYNNSAAAITVPNIASGTANITVGGGVLNAATIILNSNTANAAILTLNGGNTNTGGIQMRATTGENIVNFNGGTLTATASSTTFFTGATQANIFSGGAIFNTGSNSITVGQNFSSAAAGGSGGLNTPTVSVTTPGTGYVGAPVVNVVSGGGTGATAVATVSGGQVTGVTITNPGTGYSFPPTFNLVGGGGSGAVISNTYNPTNNANDGGIIKLGSGNLTLAGSSTYTGNTQIKAGTLTVANSSALGTGNAVLSNAATLAVQFVAPSANQVPFTGFSMVSSNFTPVINATGTSVQMTSRAGSEATAVFSPGSYSINDATGFVAGFTYTHATSAAYGTGSPPPADGVAFVVAANYGAEGEPGMDLGYVGDGIANFGVQSSVAAVVDVFQDRLETGTNVGGPSVAGSFVNQPASDTVPWISLSTSSTVTVVYNGVTNTLSETITSNSNGASYTLVTTGIDVAQLLGGSAGGSGYGYIGFTASTGGYYDTQSVSNLYFNNNGMSLPNSVAISNNVVVLPGAASTVQLGGAPLYSSGAVGPIKVNAGGLLTVANNNAAGASRGTLTTPSITFNGSGGQVDVSSNALDITAQAATPSLSLQSVWRMVASGYNGGNWNGPGIISTAAAGDATHLTAIGVIINDIGANTTGTLSGALYTSFDGATPSDGDILVKYTYYGDANLDGHVDGSDYSLIDNGFTTGLTGWYNGDFNYDGVVNGSDYTLIDNTFNTQGVQLAAQLAASPTALVGCGKSRGTRQSTVITPAGAAVLAFVFAVRPDCTRLIHC